MSFLISPIEIYGFKRYHWGRIKKIHEGLRLLLKRAESSIVYSVILKNKVNRKKQIGWLEEKGF